MRGKSWRLVPVVVVGLGVALALLWLMGDTPHACAESGPLHVAPGGDCGGATPCYLTVQAAVDAASPGDEIWVAAGTYTGVHTRTAPAGYHGPAVITQVVYISKTVTVRGGYTIPFAGPPDPEANQAILDAGGQGRVMFIADDVNPVIEGLHLSGGDATGLEGDHWGLDAGGGVFMWYNDAEVTLSNNWVFSNTAVHGGGLYLYGGAPTLSGNTVSSNTARDYGGGLFLFSSYTAMNANSIRSNTTEGGGGGMFTYYGDPTLSGNTVTYNTSDSSGGGLYVQGGAAMFINNVIAYNQDGSSGSGLHILDASPRLLHTTFVHNRGGSGIGLCVTGSTGRTPALTNTIIASQTVGIAVRPGNTVTLNATLWHGNGTDHSGTVIHANDRSGDPDFEPDSYHLGAGSAAINAGVDAGVTVDIDGDPRPVGNGYDLGADERWCRVFLPVIVRDH